MSVTRKDFKTGQDTAIMGRYNKTIKTTNAVSIPVSGYVNSDWFDCEGFDKIAVTLVNDAATNSAVDVAWSHDGVTMHGKDLNVIASANTIERAGITDVKAKFFRIISKNQDTVAAHIMNAWAYLKA